MSQRDCCMMYTTDGRGTQFSRPISKNGDIYYDCNSCSYIYEQSDKVKEIETNQSVNRSVQTVDMLFILVNGKEKIITQKTSMPSIGRDV